MATINPMIWLCTGKLLVVIIVNDKINVCAINQSFGAWSSCMINTVFLGL